MADFGELLVLWRTLHSETGAGHLNSKDFGELYVLAFLLALALPLEKQRSPRNPNTMKNAWANSRGELLTAI